MKRIACGRASPTAPTSEDNPMSLPNPTEDETFTVKVFRDHPAWDAHSAWWAVPMALVNELYVCTYDYTDPRQLDRIERQHPGCVFVY
jgi:hypothetical protein